MLFRRTNVGLDVTIRGAERAFNPFADEFVNSVQQGNSIEHQLGRSFAGAEHFEQMARESKTSHVRQPADVELVNDGPVTLLIEV